MTPFLRCSDRSTHNEPDARPCRCGFAFQLPTWRGISMGTLKTVLANLLILTLSFAVLGNWKWRYLTQALEERSEQALSVYGA